MRSQWDLGVIPEFPQAYLGDPRRIAVALPRELKIASIIAGAPCIPLEEIEEDMFLHAIGGLRAIMSDDEIN